MIEVNKSELASAMTALGKLICRTSPLAICKSIKIEAEDRTLRLTTCNLSEVNAFTETIKKYTPQRVDHSHLALNRAFGLDGSRPELWK